MVFQQVMLRWGWGWSQEDSGAICRRGALVSLHVDIQLPDSQLCGSGIQEGSPGGHPQV